MDDTERTRQDQRERYARGLPDYHDPLAGIGGAPPALSALTLRLVLAIIGLLMAIGGTVVLIIGHAPAAFWIVMIIAAVVLTVDIGVIVHRKRRGEPG